VFRAESFILRGVFLRGCSDDGCLDIVYTMIVFVKESVLGGDVYFGGCCSQGVI